VVIDYTNWTSSFAAEEDHEPPPGAYRPVHPVYLLPSRDIPNHIKVACHHGRPLSSPGSDPALRDFSVPPEDFPRRIQPWLEHRIPAVDASKAVHSETCMYTMTRNEDFVVDDASGVVGDESALSIAPGTFVLAGGMSGHGFKLGPVSGLMAASLALDGTGGLPEELSRIVFDRGGGEAHLFSLKRMRE